MGITPFVICGRIRTIGSRPSRSAGESQHSRQFLEPVPGLSGQDQRKCISLRRVQSAGQTSTITRAFRTAQFRSGTVVAVRSDLTKRSESCGRLRRGVMYMSVKQRRDLGLRKVFATRRGYGGLAAFVGTTPRPRSSAAALLFGGFGGARRGRCKSSIRDELWSGRSSDQCVWIGVDLAPITGLVICGGNSLGQSPSAVAVSPRYEYMEFDEAFRPRDILRGNAGNVPLSWRRVRAAGIATMSPRLQRVQIYNPATGTWQAADAGFNHSSAAQTEAAGGPPFSARVLCQRRRDNPFWTDRSRKRHHR